MSKYEEVCSDANEALKEVEALADDLGDLIYCRDWIEITNSEVAKIESIRDELSKMYEDLSK